MSCLAAKAEWTVHRFVHTDFRVSGLPHAVVKQAENFRVRELAKKIESHPHREALQADLQQNNVYTAFSGDSKAMIREMGNVELFELCETSKSATLRMPSFLESRNHLLHLWTSLATARQNRRTESAFCGPQCAGEMYQKEL